MSLLMQCRRRYGAAMFTIFLTSTTAQIMSAEVFLRLVKDLSAVSKVEEATYMP